MTSKEKFEKWAETEGYDLTKNLHSSYYSNDFECDYAENSWFGWQAAQADQAATITQLQADNAKLRELLSDVHLQADYYQMDDGYAIRDGIEEALGETK